MKKLAFEDAVTPKDQSVKIKISNYTLFSFRAIETVQHGSPKLLQRKNVCAHLLDRLSEDQESGFKMKIQKDPGGCTE